MGKGKNSGAPLLALKEQYSESPTTTGKWKEKIDKKFCFSVKNQGLERGGPLNPLKYQNGSHEEDFHFAVAGREPAGE